MTAALWLIRGRLGLLHALTKRYGDVVYLEIAGAPYAILNHPDMARDVLVTRHRLFHKGAGLERTKALFGDGLLTSEDPLHTERRRLLQRAFHRDRFAVLASTVVECTRRKTSAWMNGAPVDVSSELELLTLDIAAKTLLAANLENELHQLRVAVTASLRALNLMLLPQGNHLARLHVPCAIRFLRAKARMDATIRRLIAERRASGVAGDDVLSLLVFGGDGDGAPETDEQIRDEIVTLLLAGHETTANALGWTLYLLSQHSDVERAIQAEVDEVLQGRLSRFDDLPRLTYTRAVLAESMRLFPPVPVVGRRAIDSYDVPGTNYVLPAGTTILIAQFLLQRDARFWTDPERFEPGRWMDVERRRFEGDVHRAYFPFGAGPRICIGEHFAWMEGTLALATLVQQWQFRLVPNHRVEPLATLTLRAKRGIQMTCSRRDAPSRRSNGRLTGAGRLHQ